MTSSTDFFAEFPPVSKEDWLQQVAKDLKGKPLEELNWRLSDDFLVSPFVHADDFPAPPPPLSTQPNRWEICESVVVTDPIVANRQSLEALQGGAWGLQFEFETSPSFEVLSQVLEGIYIDFIGLHFSGQGIQQNPGIVLAHLERLARARELPTESLRGSLAYDPAASASIVDWRYLADLIDHAQRVFPQFKIIAISPKPTETEDPLQLSMLPALLRTGNHYLEKLSERGVLPAQTFAAMQFCIPIGKSYFFEIARLRAFKLLWVNVLKAWNITLAPPAVSAFFRPEAYSDDLYTNMIRATTMSMSAVLGGAERLTVLPYDAGREAMTAYPQSFSRRIARNVQHLLKMESGFDELSDPAAGSFYIETLTQQLSERAWAEFASV